MTEKEFILPLEKRTDSRNQSNRWQNQFQPRKKTNSKKGNSTRIDRKKTFGCYHYLQRRKKHKRVYRILFRNCR
ncbi:hypothetical protein LEP1GSC151_3328 [Leptospira interrogans serovar Grippotyphosa str. LT2186]|uniref:Uncharacterized protein n=2 Tax=Leptospira interrogans TaxID=173 RepID=M3FZ76_LEPIR|nr:hypothetical protein LEP1GSC151_3328 [Leptospira interrogans serovar Grippotyphosa str. LT2186]EMM82893.1 hypothetical protein LEP1GSC037_4855 [Leptospira interrogans str. 2006001854]